MIHFDRGSSGPPACLRKARGPDRALRRSQPRSTSPGEVTCPECQAWLHGPEAIPFGPCPHCEVPILVKTTPDQTPLAILHPSPMCARFRQLPAEDYLSELLIIRSAQRLGTAGDA